MFGDNKNISYVVIKGTLRTHRTGWMHIHPHMDRCIQSIHLYILTCIVYPPGRPWMDNFQAIHRHRFGTGSNARQ